MKSKFVLFGVVAALLVTPGQAQDANQNRFTVPIYSGPRAQPIFTGEGVKFAHVRSRIREAFTANAIAAGHYVVVQVGCGTGCTWNIVGDVRSGRLMEFPLGGEEYQGLDIITDPKSTLFIARWGDVAFSTCTTRLYSLESDRFVQVGRDEFENKSCFG